jgi:hypothetical protein
MDVFLLILGDVLALLHFLRVRQVHNLRVRARRRRKEREKEGYREGER